GSPLSLSLYPARSAFSSCLMTYDTRHTGHSRRPKQHDSLPGDRQDIHRTIRCAPAPFLFWCDLDEDSPPLHESFGGRVGKDKTLLTFGLKHMVGSLSSALTI